MKEIALKLLSLYDAINELTDKIKEDRETLKDLKERRDALTREILLALIEAK